MFTKMYKEIRTALITGVAGQDGSLLAANLLGKGYRVVGIVKPGAGLPCVSRKFETIEADLLKKGLAEELLSTIRPNEIYHLAAYHHSSQESINLANTSYACEQIVAVSFGICNELAQALLKTGIDSRLVFAASSQMYTANLDVTIVDEAMARTPSSFYGHVKNWGMTLLDQMRDRYGLNACTGILFNHESALRRAIFVTRKITQAAAANAGGRLQVLKIMNIGARVDWSAAEDVVDALHIIATSEIPQNFVIASGQLHSVRDLLSVAFNHVGLDWREYTEFDRDVREPSLCGSSQRIQMLGWQKNLDFNTWVTRMVDNDLRLIDAKP